MTHPLSLVFCLGRGFSCGVVRARGSSLRILLTYISYPFYQRTGGDLFLFTHLTVERCPFYCEMGKKEQVPALAMFVKGSLWVVVGD